VAIAVEFVNPDITHNRGGAVIVVLLVPIPVRICLSVELPAAAQVVMQAEVFEIGIYVVKVIAIKEGAVGIAV
jgi:hypothetical protein